MDNLDDKLREILEQPGMVWAPKGEYDPFLEKLIVQIRKAFEDDMNGKNFKVVPMDSNLMTGQEWLSKYEEETKHLAGALNADRFFEAAKKAAGLDG